jgi:hypothetical protein
MSNFKIVLDTKTSEITFENNLESYSGDFMFLLNRYNQTINIEGMTFGILIKLSDTTIFDKKYPPTGVKYISTSDDLLISERISNLLPESECKLSVWVSDSNGNYNKDTTFIIPKPLQPFSSWTWDGTIWTAPLPYPEDDQRYLWNEELYQSDNTKGWVLTDPS